jgi:hypothetical protein
MMYGCAGVPVDNALSARFSQRLSNEASPGSDRQGLGMRRQAFSDRFHLGAGLDCRRTRYARDQVPAIPGGILQVRISRDEGLFAHCVIIAG